MKKSKINSNTLLLIITIALFIFMYGAGCAVYANKGFTHLQTIFNILITNAGLLCVAAGMTCVMLTGGIDISVGSCIAMHCMFLAVGMRAKEEGGWGMNSVVLMVLVLIIGIVFGMVQGYLIAYLDIQPFIVTMAGLFFGRGMTAVISDQQVDIQEPLFKAISQYRIYMPANIGAYVNKKGKLMVPYISVGVVVAILVVVVIYLMLKYTKFGRSIYAIGGNQQSATLMGLNVKKVKFMTYILSGFLTAIGGICFCLNTMNGNTQQALGLEMDAISSAVIGGTLLTGGVGNVIGTLFGVMINGTISSLVKTNGKLDSSWPSVITAMLLCFFILLQAIFAKLKESKK